MENNGYSFDATALVMELHFFAMFSPGFFSGWLCHSIPIALYPPLRTYIHACMHTIPSEPSALKCIHTYIHTFESYLLFLFDYPGSMIAQYGAFIVALVGGFIFIASSAVLILGKKVL